ncbi:hypothetical protein ACFL2T_06980 [Elusimicrobiota bacterium]
MAIHWFRLIALALAPSILWTSASAAVSLSLAGAQEAARFALRGGADVGEVTRGRYSPRCILMAVAHNMNVTLREDVPLPEILLESQTPLKVFQDSIEPQWGMRPSVFLNAYIPGENRVFLMDEAGYYRRTGRFIDDSLAHELVHFVQVKYRGDMSMDESQAIWVQTWFRDNYMKGTPPPGAPACR